MLRERAKENAAEVEKAYGAVLGEKLSRIFCRSCQPSPHAENGDEEWTGISPSSNKGKQKEEEYQDEEILATVTVVEDFDPDSIIHGSPTPGARERSPLESTPTISKSTRDTGLSKKRLKGKKVKYETKETRKLERKKQRARRTEKAELAGGKASRKKSLGSSRKRKGMKR